MSSPAAITLAGRYRVQRKLGEGAFGAVYACEDLQGGPRVALKVLLSAHRDEAAAARFQREAEVALRLRHPRLISLLDSGVVEGDKPYLAFQYVDGQDLARHLRSEGRPNREVAVRWLRHLCQALSACHGAGIVHRDVKPGNIMLDEQGGVQLGDFGLAVRQDTARQLTRTGELLGTPLYASPEMLRGERPSAQGDLFSVGAVGYELLYGRPWRSATSLGALGREATSVTLPLEEEPRLGHYPDLDPWLHRMLAQAPEERFPDAREARKVLEDLSSQRPSETMVLPRRPGSTPFTQRRRLLVLGTVVAAAGVVAGVLLGDPPAPSTAPRPRVADAPAYPPELLGGLETAAQALAPALDPVSQDDSPAARDLVVEEFLDPAFPLRVRRWLRACAAAANEGLDLHVPARWHQLAVEPGRQLVVQAQQLPEVLDQLVIGDPAAHDRDALARGRRARRQAGELAAEASSHVSGLLSHLPQGRRAGMDHHLAGPASLSRHPVGRDLAGSALERLALSEVPSEALEELSTLQVLVGFLPGRRNQPDAVEHQVAADLETWLETHPASEAWATPRGLASRIVTHLRQSPR